MPRTPAFLSAFQSFISKGNVVDLAIAVIMAGAFGKVVNSVVTLLMTNILEPALKEANVASLSQLPAGEVLVALINFIVIAFVCFVIVKTVEATKRKREAVEASKPDPQAQLASAMTRLTEVIEAQSSSLNS
ncbi:large conductance mechanosensitive channel protein MscL [Synechococcus sp. MIT S9451]|uniref:large conductance mechanosensitive channel protein MscL n=1 Tax=Synechococcus sp. MIT S9451 TaxID=3082543 RepID=UPI0039B68D04